MRALALMTDVFGGYGGIAQFNRDLMKALGRDERIDRIDILPRIADVFNAPAPPLAQLAPTHNRYVYALRALAHAIKTRPDIIINGHIYHGPMSICLARLVGAKVVSILHGIEIWGEVAASHLAALQSSDIVVCVSTDTRARYIDRLTAGENDNTFVLPNTVAEAFSPSDRTVARQKWGIGQEHAILTVGRIDKRDGYKGNDRIISILSELQRPERPVHYLIAGVGDDCKRLEALANSHGMADFVRFLGKVPDAEMPDLYRAADVFALPSTGEGFGIVFIEAMACGTRTIGLDVGGARDALGNGEFGVCVSTEEFPKALNDLLDLSWTDEQRRELSRRVIDQFGQMAFRKRAIEMMGTLLLENNFDVDKAPGP